LPLARGPHRQMAVPALGGTGGARPIEHPDPQAAGARRRGDAAQSARPQRQAQSRGAGPMIRADAAERLLERPSRRRPAEKEGKRWREDNDVSPPPRLALARPAGTRPPRPAAHEWQEARLPILGRLWATAWLPSVL